MLSFLKNIFKKDESRSEQTPPNDAPVVQPEIQTEQETVVTPLSNLHTEKETSASETFESTTSESISVTEHNEIVKAKTDIQAEHIADQPENIVPQEQTEIIETIEPVAETLENTLPEAEVIKPESVALSNEATKSVHDSATKVLSQETITPAIETTLPENENTAVVETQTHADKIKAGAVVEVGFINKKTEVRSSWASPTVSHTETEETFTQKVSHWTHDMSYAVKDKAEEWEMRAEIVAEESGEAVKSWASNAEKWVDGMAHVVQDKVNELEMRAEIIATEAEQAIEESIDTIGHAVIPDAPPHAEMLPEYAEQEVHAPPPADAATDIDEAHLAKYHREHSNDTFQKTATDASIVAAESATVFAGDEEVAQSWTARLARGLSKSRNQMAKSLAGVLGGGKIDEDLYEDLETVLITSDMGIEATEYLMKEVRNRVSLKGLNDGNELRQALKGAVYDLIKPLEQPLEIPNNGRPFVIMTAGINGAGKTTSIGKLAKYFQSQGKTVMLAAGDTFRAAAREQLQEWGARTGVTVVSQASGDSAAVCFDAVESAKAKGIDIVLADTAGRLPTQLHLMEEIKKVKRVLQKSIPDAPHEVILVLDANIGQNAVNQVIAFDDALGVTGLIVTKLDGTAKGGVLAALASNRPIPVRYIGVGEHIDDLRPFNARAFVEALFEEQQ